MLFNSFAFLFFFLAVYSLYLVLEHRWQNRLLLAASYFFYGSWDWRFLSLIFFSTAINFFCGKAVFATAGKPRAKLILWFSLVANLGLLGFFKYYNFFVESLNALLIALGGGGGVVSLNIILPVGISFYTFQAMSYTIDVYRGELEPEASFADFALFVSFFPQLVAGPIERASRLLPQVLCPRKISAENIGKGLWLIAWGFFLKVFMADNLSLVADRLFMKNSLVEGWDVLLGVYAFAFQIFGDFAGYSSIAIGLGKLMGFELNTNFLFPYFVQSPSQFWRHWHISLSEWLRDYLYIPLGGNRGSLARVCRNLGITMFCAGLWHGAAWTYVLWGLYHGFLLMLHRLWSQSLGSVRRWFRGRIWALVKMVLVFHLVCVNDRPYGAIPGSA